ncbi:MAG: hypothetical protein ACO1RX_14510 [Candidatus Sericytochromatia bacterium]
MLYAGDRWRWMGLAVLMALGLWLCLQRGAWALGGGLAFTALFLAWGFVLLAASLRAERREQRAREAVGDWAELSHALRRLRLAALHGDPAEADAIAQRQAFQARFWFGFRQALAASAKRGDDPTDLYALGRQALAQMQGHVEAQRWPISDAERACWARLQGLTERG